ncbi:MAG: GNAT family N-acetyltransferase [Actinomycetota bacterium]
MLDIRLRPARSGDGEGLARSWVDAGRYYADLDAERFQVPMVDGLVEWFEEDLAEPASEEVITRVAEVDGRIVGWIYARVVPSKDNARWQLLRELSESQLVVEALVVEEAYRRQRVGTRLMESAEEWARSKGASIASVDTYIDSPISVPFYEDRMGYARKSLRFGKPLR